MFFLKYAPVQGNYPSRVVNNKECANKSFTRLQDDRNAGLYPFLDLRGNYSLEDEGRGENRRGRLWDTKCAAIQSCRSADAHIEYICKVRPRRGAWIFSLLREKFWILKVRESNRAILWTCNVSGRHEAKRITASRPTSPAPRVWDAAVFETTDVDMAGPLSLGDGRKMYVMSVHPCGISCGSLGIGIVIHLVSHQRMR